MADMAPIGTGSGDSPWPLLRFDRSLKELLRFEALQRFLPLLSDKRCLLVSCGENDGAINWHVRALGGDWEWGDVTGENLAEMSDFLGEPVLRIPEDNAPFPSGVFDCIVAIDVLEHLEDDQPFLHEMRRLLQADGQLIVMAPNGDTGLLANRIRAVVGMKPEQLGLTRVGYTAPELSLALRQAQLIPGASGGYARFFTEMIELVRRFGSVRTRSRQQVQRSGPEAAQDAADHTASRETDSRLYLFLLPLLRRISQLDRWLPERGNYAVIVVAQKGDG